MAYSVSSGTQRCFSGGHAIAVLVCLLVAPGLLPAQGITVGPSGSISLGGGAISLGCFDLQIDGTLNMESGSLTDVRHFSIGGTLNAQTGTIDMTGNWANQGTVNAGSSAVNVTDGCGTASSTVSGNTTFYDWSVATSSGKQLSFNAGDTQDVLNEVVFNGAVGSLLQIRSTITDSPGFLRLDEAGAQSVDYVDVRDNHAPMPGQFMAPGAPEDYNSVDSGGNFRWFGSNTFTITVHKDFNDGNPAEVLVHKQCNTGLPLNVSIGVQEGNPITFITKEIDSGATNCTVTETVPLGYSVSYATEDGGETNPDGCVYENIEQGSELVCFILNSVTPVEVNVRKLWFDEHPEFNYPTLAEAAFACSGEGELDGNQPPTSGSLWFLGADTFDTFEAIPHWNGQTSCTVTEQVSDLSVESDDSDCQQVPILLGQATNPAGGEYDCTIFNTRLYQGIPTLGRGGSLLLMLLLFAFGLVGLRRIHG